MWDLAGQAIFINRVRFRSSVVGDRYSIPGSADYPVEWCVTRVSPVTADSASSIRDEGRVAGNRVGSQVFDTPAFDYCEG
jgi:hypothetical protein